MAEGAVRGLKAVGQPPLRKINDFYREYAGLIQGPEKGLVNIVKKADAHLVKLLR